MRELLVSIKVLLTAQSRKDAEKYRRGLVQHAQDRCRCFSRVCLFRSSSVDRGES